MTDNNSLVDLGDAIVEKQTLVVSFQTKTVSHDLAMSKVFFLIFSFHFIINAKTNHNVMRFQYFRFE